MALSNPNQLSVAMVKALGLKHCTKLVITMEVGIQTTAEATFYPEAGALEGVVQKFTLEATPVLECGRADPETRP